MNIVVETGIWITAGFCFAGLCWLVGVKFQAIVSALNISMSE